MKTHVIYHSADMDGMFSGAVCYHWLTMDTADALKTMQRMNFKP